MMVSTFIDLEEKNNVGNCSHLHDDKMVNCAVLAQRMPADEGSAGFGWVVQAESRRHDGRSAKFRHIVARFGCIGTDLFN